jgi:hypothetical protein
MNSHTGARVEATSHGDRKARVDDRTPVVAVASALKTLVDIGLAPKTAMDQLGYQRLEAQRRLTPRSPLVRGT